MLSISWFATGWSPFSLAVTALAGMLAGYYWVWSRSRFVRLIDALPGPKPLPMLGNILHFANFSLDDVKYEPIYRIWIGYYPAVFVAHYKLFESILSNPKLINRPYDYEYLFHGESLSVFTDDAWRKRRRMLNPAFHFQNLNEFIGTFNDLSLDCAAELEQMLEAAQHKEIDVFPIMSKLTLDILSETSMGRKSWSEEETTNFVQCLERLEHVFMQRCFHQPWLRSDFIFKLSPLYRLEQRYTSISRSLIDKVIQNRLELQKKNGQCESVFNDNEEEDEFKRPRDRYNSIGFNLVSLCYRQAPRSAEIGDGRIGSGFWRFRSAGDGAGFDSTQIFGMLYQGIIEVVSVPSGHCATFNGRRSSRRIHLTKGFNSHIKYFLCSSQSGSLSRSACFQTGAIPSGEQHRPTSVRLRSI
ncbi:cytochrome P450 4c3-like isoform X2 [Daphnia pulicaria]|uniref:cytochrome P450 4c3-like isoform X2 n=1 Tax=Daphnia pulicaria TaxID=35523 RepID=UPI001EEC9C84|nr:cytochrome P450 4c3-like isoform X2 [Daphnia pulicaria]